MPRMTQQQVEAHLMGKPHVLYCGGRIKPNTLTRVSKKPGALHPRPYEQGKNR